MNIFQRGSWSIYAIGAYILARLWIWLLAPYLLYVLWLEIRLLRTACVDCAYYGKACAFGKGKLCAMAFERGDPQQFAEHEISWAEMLPDLLVSILPLIGGVALLVREGWDWLIAALLAVLFFLAFVGTGLVRGSLACTHCKQRGIGCAGYGSVIAKRLTNSAASSPTMTNIPGVSQWKVSPSCQPSTVA